MTIIELQKIVNDLVDAGKGDQEILVSCAVEVASYELSLGHSRVIEVDTSYDAANPDVGLTLTGIDE